MWASRKCMIGWTRWGQTKLIYERVYAQAATRPDKKGCSLTIMCSYLVVQTLEPFEFSTPESRVCPQCKTGRLQRKPSKWVWQGMSKCDRYATELCCIIVFTWHLGQSKHCCWHLTLALCLCLYLCLCVWFGLVSFAQMDTSYGGSENVLNLSLRPCAPVLICLVLQRCSLYGSSCACVCLLLVRFGSFVGCSNFSDPDIKCAFNKRLTWTSELCQELGALQGWGSVQMHWLCLAMLQAGTYSTFIM